MNLTSQYSAATYMFPAQKERLFKVLANLELTANIKEEGTKQILTIEVPDECKPDDIFKLGMLVQACIN